jgi:hypothetical protein
MYRKNQYRQFSITDFNQPFGLKMNPENRWVKKAAMIPWKAIEEKYATLFPSKTGMPAKPLRMALGSLLIQKQLGFSDRELVEEIVENPYFQYFIGLPAYQTEAPFVPSLLVEFRKRLNEDVLNEINEIIIAFNTPDDPNPGGGKHSDDDTSAGSDENTGTLVLDATCAPQNIKYPQDVNLLNEARENLEEMVDYLCTTFDYYTPRMYRRNARKDYLNLAKSKKRPKKKIRRAIRQQLQYIRRDRGYIEALLDDGCELTIKQRERLAVIDKVYEQQKYMYDNRTHTVADRIVSISQPYIRPIVRGKAKAPVEFGAKLDVSLDERGMARIERISFDAYNECDVLIQAVENHKARTGHYPERVLVDQIYRTRANLTYCKNLKIRVSGPALGRPKKDAKVDKKVEYKDNTDRIAVERAFALAKHSYGLGLVVTKRGETTKSSIALSILAMNLDRILAGSLRQILILIFSRYNQRKNTLRFIQNKRYENLVAC